MNVLASVRAAFEEILANRSRSLLSMVSIIVGVWSVTVVVAASDLGRQALVQSLEQTLGRPATITVTTGTSLPAAMAAGLLRVRLASVLHEYAVEQASPVEAVSVPVNLAGASASITLKGVSPAFSQVQLVTVEAGRWLTADDVGSLAPMMVMNTAAAGLLGFNPPITALGASVRLGMLAPVNGRVVGVVGALSQEQPVIYSPAAVLEQWGAPPGSKFTFSYVARVDPAQSDKLIGLLKFDLNQWGVSDGLTVQRTDQIENVNGGLLAVQVVLTAIAGIALLTGGIGMLNLGLVTARERIHEFGIRRAFGATRVSIFVVVFAEAVVTTTLAGLVGVTLAIVTVIFLPATLASVVGGAPVTGSFPIVAALIGLGLAAIVGILAGVIPARRATKTEVVEAIRH